ncbi:hypothetical protein JY651_27480 [Pyxidicoccus parkwayensis]|uniref:Uncharacterized protein n=1 Tax=Pyxidicoccus parkwayensis TaxID=2813578 RepID=A0ABX7NL35_9BACT|nr:Ig-like domain-containing protein [Pyxidicoccus parkwaysis]QSQ19089.1 hypothetical protein JY651_27480 [Pyxidicoccus parkwaysis]
MRIMSRGARGIAAALFGAGAMAATGCGEVQGTPESTPPQVQQAKAPTGCSTAIAPERELVIQDVGVLNDKLRTGWSGTLSKGSGAADGAWSFGRLMAGLSGAVAPEDFVRDWFTRWAASAPAHGQDLTRVLADWPKRADGKLDLTKSPLRLQAIVNHLDARDVSRGSAGEGHLVFGVLDASGNPLPLTVTFAYDVPARTSADVLDWAHRWHALASRTPGTEAFNTALQDVTDRFTAGTGRAHGGALDSLLTPGASGANEARRLANDLSCLLADDVEPPTVALTAPASGSFARGSVAITADATDDTGVDRVDFFDGTSLIGSATQAPFSVNWDTTVVGSGTHSLTAQAFDAAGNSGTSSAVSVLVDNYPPVLVQGSPQYNTQTQNYVRGTVTVGWTVTDQSLSGVALVEFFRDGVPVASVPGNGGLTYSFAWNTVGLSNRAYTIAVRATDNAGNVANSSRSLIVDNVAPSSQLTAPANGAVVSGVVTLKANASDTQALAYVAFEVDGQLLTPYSTTSPYTKTWDSTGKSGTHVIVAVAVDRAGNSKRSNQVTVTVP